MRRAAPLFLTAGVMFAIRWWISGGLGGYPRALPPASSAKALSVRLWVVPLFPLNWSRPLSFGVAITLPTPSRARAEPASIHGVHFFAHAPRECLGQQRVR